ncbi:MAG: hypothetical protein ACYDAO_08660 [Thermoplasmataceae archaeon]
MSSTIRNDKFYDDGIKAISKSGITDVRMILLSSSKTLKDRRAIRTKIYSNITGKNAFIKFKLIIIEDDYKFDNYEVFKNEIKFFNLAEIKELIVYMDGPGPISEVSSSWNNKKVAKKFKIFVDSKFHPLTCNQTGVITSALANIMAKYGHVYPIYNRQKSKEVIIRFIEILIHKYTKT